MPMPSKLQIALGLGYAYMRWLISHWFRKLTFTKHPLGWSKEEDKLVIDVRVMLSFLSIDAVRDLQQGLVESAKNKVRGLQLLCVPAATFQTPGFRDSWWISLNPESRPEKPKASVVMMYLHGGGWRTGHPLLYAAAYKSWLQGLADKGIHARIFSVGYPLAPEHRFPVPVQGVVEAYHWLVKELGGSSDKIILAGDSAGGNLVMTSLEYMRSSAARASVPPPPTSAPAAAAAAAAPFASPLAAILISPATDLRSTAPSSRLPYTPYDLLTPAAILNSKRSYLPKGWTPELLSSTLLSPVCMSDYGGLVQTKALVMTGGSEMLVGDNDEFVEKVSNSPGGLVVEYHVEKDQPHCYPVLGLKELTDRGADVLVPFVISVADAGHRQ